MLIKTRQYAGLFGSAYSEVYRELGERATEKEGAVSTGRLHLKAAGSDFHSDAKGYFREMAGFDNR